MEEKIGKALEVPPPTRFAPLAASRGSGQAKPATSQQRWEKPAPRPQQGGQGSSPQQPQRNLPNRPVPFRPGMKVEPLATSRDRGQAAKPVQAPVQPKKKPNDSLLKKVISAMEAKKPWVPGQKPAKPNPVADLGGDKKSIEDIRRQKSEEAQSKPNESIRLDEDSGTIDLSNPQK